MRLTETQPSSPLSLYASFLALGLALRASSDRSLPKALSLGTTDNLPAPSAPLAPSTWGPRCSPSPELLAQAWPKSPPPAAPASSPAIATPRRRHPSLVPPCLWQSHRRRRQSHLHLCSPALLARWSLHRLRPRPSCPHLLRSRRRPRDGPSLRFAHGYHRHYARRHGRYS